MKEYCVIVCTELARADHDYFEKPYFFDSLEEAKSFADRHLESIQDYPANADVCIYKALFEV